MSSELDLSFYPYLASGAFWQGLPTVSGQNEPPSGWVWAPLAWPKCDGTLDTIDTLTAAGWERMPGAYLQMTGPQLFHLFGQLGHLIAVQMSGIDEPEIWARSADLRRTTERPVMLGFVLDRLPDGAAPTQHENGAITLRMAGALPPPQLGTIGLVYVNRIPGENTGGWKTYYLDALDEDAQHLQQRLGDALRELAGPADWRQACSKVPRELWLEQWGEIQAMAQQLAAAYWEAHQTGHTASRTHTLAPLTSAHRTFIPSHNAPRAVWQTFGPGVQPSLWNLDPNNQAIELQTPNKSLVRISPQEGPELAVLHRYVLEGLTPEGIKHAVGVLSAYADQTGGVDQKTDARVSLRQLLLRMGKPESHADNPDEQRRLYHTIMYLARCAVHASDRPEDPRPPGSYRRRKGREYREYSPMLVIERVQFEETTDGETKEIKVRVPREVTFHLGVDYYHLLFGQGRSFFTIPTALVLSYHPDREQQELLLAMYLSDMLSWNRNPWRVSFHQLMLQSALRSADDLDHGHDRLRDAMRVLLAVERLERDGLLLREAHPDIDTALACELAQGNIKAETLAEATRKRLAAPTYHTLTTAADPALMRERRRRALQSLLDGKAPSLALSAGPLLREQVERREAKRKEATERDERTLTARVIKNAVPRIVAAMQTEGQSTTKPGQKRRGRPRKFQ